MNRFFVPVVVAATISGLGFGLVVGIIARSPETHANVRPEGYDRTPIAYLTEQASLDVLGLADPELILEADPVERGRLLFQYASCVTCHGLDNRGGVVAPVLDVGDLTLSDLQTAVRSGPSGMPVFPMETLSDEDLAAIYAFLQALREGVATPFDISTPPSAEEKK